MNGDVDGESTPLDVAVRNGAVDCVSLLIARGGDALEMGGALWRAAEAGHADIVRLLLPRVGGGSFTVSNALRSAAECGHAHIVRLLLLEGADTSSRDFQGRIALDRARIHGHQACIALLEAAVAAPEYPRLLLKARALLDARVAIPKAHDDARRKNLPVYEHIRAVLAAAPPCLRPFVANGRDVPVLLGVSGDDEELVACDKYALGLEGGVGVVMEGQAPQVGMLPELYRELCEMITPKCVRKHM